MLAASFSGNLTAMITRPTLHRAVHLNSILKLKCCLYREGHLIRQYGWVDLDFGCYPLPVPALAVDKLEEMAVQLGSMVEHLKP